MSQVIVRTATPPGFCSRQLGRLDSSCYQWGPFQTGLGAPLCLKRARAVFSGLRFSPASFALYPCNRWGLAHNGYVVYARMARAGVPVSTFVRFLPPFWNITQRPRALSSNDELSPAKVFQYTLNVLVDNYVFFVLVWSVSSRISGLGSCSEVHVLFLAVR